MNFRNADPFHILEREDMDFNPCEYSTHVELIRVLERREKHDGYFEKRQDVADVLGVSLNVLNRFMNGSRRTRKRDLVIGVYYLYTSHLSEEMVEDTINRGLELCGMAPLNKTNPRDEVILDGIKDRDDIEKINSELIRIGGDDYALDVCGRGKKSRNPQLINDTVFRMIKHVVEPSTDEERSSLCIKYVPFIFSISGFMWIEDASTHDIYQLEDDGKYVSVSQKNPLNNVFEKIYTNHPLIAKAEGIQQDKPMSLRRYLRILRQSVTDKAKAILRIANDTRNYRIRMSAEVKDGNFIVFGETFDYNNPEQELYYQIEACATQVKLSVSCESCFLKRYLGSDQYSKYYEIASHGFLREYSCYQGLKSLSVEEIESGDNFISTDCLRLLVSEAKRLVLDIRERRQFINAEAEQEIADFLLNADQRIISQDRDSVLDLFVDYEGGVYDSETLQRAMELDITTKEELALAISNWGTLENMIDI